MILQRSLLPRYVATQNFAQACKACKRAMVYTSNAILAIFENVWGAAAAASRAQLVRAPLEPVHYSVQRTAQSRWELRALPAAPLRALPAGRHGARSPRGLGRADTHLDDVSV